MKNIKNSYLLAVAVTLFVVNIVAMRMTPQQVERRKVAVQQVIRKNQYFIYETDNPENGIWVDKNFVKQNCKSIKAMVEDLGSEPNEIPFPTSVDIIKLGFDLLQKKKDVKNLLFKELIDVANLFNFLDVPADKLKAVLVKIKETIDSDPNNIAGNETLKKLNPDLQKLIMTEVAINCLKDCIAQKYTKDRGKSLVGHPDDVRAVALSPDGTKMVSGYFGSRNNLILWDISNPQNITHQTLVGHPDYVFSVALSPDGTKMVSGCLGTQSNLILWDISDPQNITHQTLVGHPGGVNAIAFSPDGKQIISGCRGVRDNLILWDISNPQNITHQTLVGHPDYLHSVAFSPDGKQIISGCDGDQDNLILWDISNPQNITHQILVGHPDYVSSVALSPDGKQIISGCDGDQDNLILWDISNSQNITHQTLVGHPGGVNAIAFSPDGKQIISGCYGGRDVLILWDISNPQNITHQTLVGHPESVISVAFSPDGTKIASGCRSDKNNLYLWTLLTDQEGVVLSQIKNYNADQVRLTYQLCLQSSKQQAIELKKGSEKQQIFMTLPEGMQKLLTDLFLPKGWLSGWWS